MEEAPICVLVEVVPFVDVLVELDVAAAVVDADTDAGLDEPLEDADNVAAPGTHWSRVMN